MRPVDNINYWKERLELAKKQGHLHYSVYLAVDHLWNRVHDIHMEILKREIKPTDKVLDIGCGYGRMSPYFDHYTGIDFSPDFIKEAKELHPGKKFIKGRIEKMRFKDKQFDVGFAISMKAMIVGNLGEAVWQPMEEECKRVCKKVLLLEYGKLESRFDSDEDVGKYEIL